MKSTENRRPPAAGIGRKKGTKNKATKAVKEAILAAFEEVGAATYLVTVAREDPKTFCALLGKVIPLQVKGEVNGTVRHGGTIQIELVPSNAGPDTGGV